MAHPYLQLHAPPRRGRAADTLRLLVALGLRRAGMRLDALARRLEACRPAAPRSLQGAVEFHADAGAPEGALYVDGRLVGWLEGVNRL